MMLTLRIITVGRDKERWVSEHIEHYRKLIARYARLEVIAVAESRYGKATDINRALTAEAAAVEKQLAGGYLIVTDVTGRAFDTGALARKLQALQNAGHSRLEFVIGGPFGISETLKKRADLLLSLSPMTMSHQITRLVLLEQIYRVLDMNAGGKYHK
jgi:23S rRNA (pseudouridine1915-N3)-methyltransferase